MSAVKTIEFVFENCESLLVPVEGIASFNTGVIQEYYNGGGGRGDISLKRHIDGFTAVFDKKATVTSEWTEEGDTPSLERFKGCDVTQLILEHEDGTITHMHVLWESEDWQTCDGQECLISENGNYLFTSVSGEYQPNVDIEDVDWVVRSNKL